MKNFYLVVNSEKNTGELTENVCRCITGRGGKYTVLERPKRKREWHEEIPAVPEDTDCIITFGGDGTLIRAARDFAVRNIPIIGINVGHMGYLTETAADGNVDQIISDLMEDRYRIEERMMLTGRIYHNGEAVEENIALNDITLSRVGELRALRFNVYVNGEFLNSYSGDGILVASPTGSTAYNLSAGGPIAQPESRLLILTPICPHNMTSRSIVFEADDVITIEVDDQNEAGQSASFDGDISFPLGYRDRIEVRRSARITKLAKLNEESFLDVLKAKMI